MSVIVNKTKAVQKPRKEEKKSEDKKSEEKSKK